MMNSLWRVISTGLDFVERIVLYLQTTKPGPGSWEELPGASERHLTRPLPARLVRGSRTPIGSTADNLP
jgi:hypothetical protein